jgi:hypothetical protein
MEAVTAAIFITAAVIGAVDFLKRVFPKPGEERDTRGALIIVVAAVLGILVGIFDVRIGIPNITVAQGFIIGLGATGFYQTAKVL